MVLKEKSLDFAVKIVNLYKHLKDKKSEYVLSKQILRSGTSIGANIRESKHAESNQDFIHKLAISQKEAGETEYWLILLFRTEYISKNKFDSLSSNLSEIRRMLASSILTVKKKLKKA
ncbi:MAG: four helix bundle protein [Candidatus Delongbacteria bacterium]|jgi:four helix bundle protein|nr:four helix bundle protein [Candidatus Delongbacteria bacterium]